MEYSVQTRGSDSKENPLLSRRSYASSSESLAFSRRSQHTIARRFRVSRGYAVANENSVMKVVPNEDGEHAMAWQAEGSQPHERISCFRSKARCRGCK